MTISASIVTRARVRNRARNIVELTFDSSYPAGGEAVTANLLGLNTLETVLIQSVSDQTNDIGYEAAYDRSNSKIQVFCPVGVALKSWTARADWTDGGSTTGTLDFAANAVPAKAHILGWVAVVTGAGSGDTSAVMKVGVAADDDRFSADVTQSVFAATTVGTGSIAADTMDSVVAAVTPRITVTTATDFTAINTAFAGTCFVHYIGAGHAMGANEIPDTSDLSSVIVTVEAIGY